MVDTKAEQEVSVVDSSESSVNNSSAVTVSSTSNEPNSTADKVDNDISSAVVDKPKPEKDLVVEAFQYLHQGKRHLIVSDYKSAVPSFERACEIFDSCYGTGAAECGEAYLNYGIALFELSRLEEGIFDGGVHVENQLSSEDDDDDDDNDGNEDEEEQEKETEQGDTEKEDNEAEVKEDTEETVPDDKADIDLTQPSTSKNDPSTSNGDKSDDEDADCASNFEIAWEVLSLARDIFSRNEHSRENNLNLAEALQKLAEISIEWENNENAIYLLNECLECRKESLQPDDRLIAVTYHYLGVAFSCKSDYDSANSCFENALSVIQLRLKHLKEKNIDLLDQLEKDSHHKEILQLEGLIPELQLKIQDQKEQMQSKFKTLKSLEEETKKEESKQLPAKPNKPVNNISHLIKRKREPEESEKNSEVGAESLKKVCAESVDSAMTEVSAATTEASN